MLLQKERCLSINVSRGLNLPFTELRMLSFVGTKGIVSLSHVLGNEKCTWIVKWQKVNKEMLYGPHNCLVIRYLILCSKLTIPDTDSSVFITQCLLY